MKSLKSEANEIRKLLLECDLSKLNETLLEQLDKNLPEDKIIQQYANIKCPLEELDASEQFLVELSKIKGLRKRIQCFLFKHKFQEQLEQVKIVKMKFKNLSIVQESKLFMFFFRRNLLLVHKHVLMLKIVINLNVFWRYYC